MWLSHRKSVTRSLCVCVPWREIRGSEQEAERVPLAANDGPRPLSCGGQERRIGKLPFPSQCAPQGALRRPQPPRAPRARRPGRRVRVQRGGEIQTWEPVCERGRNKGSEIAERS